MTGHKFNGLININKDRGLTSHDVVSKLRKILAMKKIGHTGTLDPLVDGVLPICLGKATRVAEYLLEYDKTYQGRVGLGKKTSTQDSSGESLVLSSYKPSLEELENIANRYQGKIKQIPPMYSALKHKGKKLYDLARKGKEVDRKERLVEIFSLHICEYKYPYFSFICNCSKGTYMRTLFNDIGEDLGSYAYLDEMTRISVENFKIEDSYTLRDIEEMTSRNDFSFIIPMDLALKKFNRIDLDKRHFKSLINGIQIALEYTSEDPINTIYCGNEFIGIGHTEEKDKQNKLIVDKMLYVE